VDSVCLFAKVFVVNGLLNLLFSLVCSQSVVLVCSLSPNSLSFEPFYGFFLNLYNFGYLIVNFWLSFWVWHIILRVCDFIFSSFMPLFPRYSLFSSCFPIHHCVWGEQLFQKVDHEQNQVWERYLMINGATLTSFMKWKPQIWVHLWSESVKNEVTNEVRWGFSERMRWCEKNNFKKIEGNRRKKKPFFSRKSTFSGHYTPLHLASINGHLITVSLLLQHNSNIESKNQNNFIFSNHTLFRSCNILKNPLAR
jgi:hypothetical protein